MPEVWGSTYDVRALLDAAVKLRDGRKLTDMELPLMGRIALKEALKKIEGTDLEKFLRQYQRHLSTAPFSERYSSQTQKTGCCTPEAGSSARSFVLICARFHKKSYS